MENPNYPQVIKKATELVKKYKILEPIIPVFDIAEQEGLSIRFVDMPEKLKDISGLLDPVKKIIFVNKSDHPNRQVFTVAHELGHYLLDHKAGEYGVLPRWKSYLFEKNPKEKEADAFAANLLVPADMLKNTMDKYSLTKDDTEILAKLFGVSKEVIQFRLNWI